MKYMTDFKPFSFTIGLPQVMQYRVLSFKNKEWLFSAPPPPIFFGKLVKIVQQKDLNTNQKASNLHSFLM